MYTFCSLQGTDLAWMELRRWRTTRHTGACLREAEAPAASNPTEETLRLGEGRKAGIQTCELSACRLVSIPAFAGMTRSPSRPLDEAVDDLLLPGLVEIDRELVAVDLRHAAIAEFLVEHAHAKREPRTFRRA